MKKYEKPQVDSENITIAEPVETGCCLRSCGGSPGRIGRKDLMTEETKGLFENLKSNS